MTFLHGVKEEEGELKTWRRSQRGQGEAGSWVGLPPAGRLELQCLLLISP